MKKESKNYGLSNKENQTNLKFAINACILGYKLIKSLYFDPRIAKLS